MRQHDKAEILKIIVLVFGRNDVFIKSFWFLLTFNLMTLISGTHLLATSKETKTKLNTDFDIPLTEEAVKKRKEDKRLQEVIVSIESPGEGPGEGPPDKGPPGEGPPAEDQVDCTGEEPANLAQSPAEGPAAEGPVAQSPTGGLGNIAQSFLKYKL